MRATMTLTCLLALPACTPQPVIDETGAEPQVCPEGLLEGECAPDFALPEASGDEVALSDYSGDVVLVASEAMW